MKYLLTIFALVFGQDVINPKLTDMQSIEGTWIVHYMRGLGTKLHAYRECISLNIKVTGERVTIQDRRRFDKEISLQKDYTMAEETFRCNQDVSLQSLALVKEKKMSHLVCENIDPYQFGLNIIGLFKKKDDQFMILYNDHFHQSGKFMMVATRSKTFNIDISKYLKHYGDHGFKVSQSIKNFKQKEDEQIFQDVNSCIYF